MSLLAFISGVADVSVTVVFHPPVRSISKSIALFYAVSLSIVYIKTVTVNYLKYLTYKR